MMCTSEKKPIDTSTSPKRRKAISFYRTMQSLKVFLLFVHLASQCSGFAPSSQQKNHLAVRTISPSSSFIIPHEKPNDFSTVEQTREDTYTPIPEDVYDPVDAFENKGIEKALDELKEFAATGGVPDLDGKPLSNEFLAHHMGIDTVHSYTCPQEEVFRGFMSNGCRLHIQPGGQTAFYKSIFFEHLSHAQEKLRTAPFKLSRDAHSYQVVADFLSSKARQAVTETTGVCIPKCYHAELRPDAENPIKTKCSFLMEDLSPDKGWYQHWLLLDEKECKASLRALAKIHAFFWHGSNFWNDQEGGAELEASIWESGSYVQPIAKNPDQCQIVAREWKLKRMKFEEHLSSLECWDNLGERLQRVAAECGRLAHPFAKEGSSLSKEYQKFRTFTHGDPKVANLLFRSQEGQELPQVGLIDFQWAGFGLAATDVAHFFTSSIHAKLMVDGGEEMLLRYYFDELQKSFVEYGAYDTREDALEQYSYDTFLEQYEIGVLDVWRLVIAYTWDRFDKPVEPDDKQGCARTMNKTSYNKSIPTIVWLISRCDEILKKQETEASKMMLLSQ